MAFISEAELAALQRRPCHHTWVRDEPRLRYFCRWCATTVTDKEIAYAYGRRDAAAVADRKRWGIWSKHTESWYYDHQWGYDHPWCYPCVYLSREDAKDALIDMTMKHNRDHYEVRAYADDELDDDGKLRSADDSGAASGG